MARTKSVFDLNKSFQQLLSNEEISYFTRKTWARKIKQGQMTEGKMIDILAKYGWTFKIVCAKPKNNK